MVQLAKDCKKYMIKELTEKLRSACGLFVTDIAGLPNKEMEDLRRNLRTAKAECVVVKNTVCRLALKELKLDQINPLIEGTIAIGISGEDMVQSSKILVNFSRDHKLLKIKGAILDGMVITPDRVNELALLPPKEVLIARVVGGIKAPIGNFVNLLRANLSNLVNVLHNVHKKKEEQK
jgi:large subunit ribosomal protein L10